MAAGRPILSLWTDLACAGGTQVAISNEWSSGRTVLQEDGRDQATFVVPSTDPVATMVHEGMVVRAEYLDGEVEEWVVQSTQDAWPDGGVTITAAGSRVALAERVPLFDATGPTGSATFTASGNPAEILTTLQGTPFWPAWVTTGAIESEIADVEVSISVSQAHGLAAVEAVVAALNAKRDETLDPVVLRWTRNGDTGYEIDLITDLDDGAVIASGKNLQRMTITRDRYQQQTALIPVGAGAILAGEAYFRIRYDNAGPTIGGNPTRAIGIEPLDLRRIVILEDDQWVGYYVRDSAGTSHEILGSAVGAPNPEFYVPTGSTYATGAAQITDASGAPVLMVEIPSAPTPPRIGFLSSNATRATNWWPNAGFEFWASGAPSGWTLGTSSGTVSWSEENADQETGVAAIEMSNGAGVSGTGLVQVSTQLPAQVREGDWKVGVRAYFERTGTKNGGVNITMANGVSPISLSGTTSQTWTGSQAGWRTLEATFTMAAGSAWSPSLRIAVTSNGTGSGRALIDRAWLFRVGIDDGDDTLVGSEMTELVANAMRRLRYTGGQPAVTYAVTVADRYRDDSANFPGDELRPFTTARLIVPERSIDVGRRVVQVSRDLQAPLSTQVQLGTIRSRITRS